MPKRAVIRGHVPTNKIVDAHGNELEPSLGYLDVPAQGWLRVGPEYDEETVESGRLDSGANKRVAIEVFESEIVCEGYLKSRGQRFADRIHFSGTLVVNDVLYSAVGDLSRSGSYFYSVDLEPICTQPE